MIALHVIVTNTTTVKEGGERAKGGLKSVKKWLRNIINRHC